MKSQCCSEGVPVVQKASKSRESIRILLYCLELLVGVMISLKVMSLIYKKCSVLAPLNTAEDLNPFKKVPFVSRSLNIFPFPSRGDTMWCSEISRRLKLWHCCARQSYEPKPFPTSREMQKKVEQFKFLRLFFSLLGVSLRAVPNPHLQPLSILKSFKQLKTFLAFKNFHNSCKKRFRDWNNCNKFKLKTFLDFNFCNPNE